MIEGLAQFLGQKGVDFGRFATVFDIGSRDGRQSLELSKLFYQATVVAIECNPQTLDQCRRNISGIDRIQLVDKAVNTHTGRCRFFPIDTERTITSWRDGNPGASSLFVANGDYPVETYVQREIEVDCIRLDDLCRQRNIEAIDLIWMDLQGAELLALESAGRLLDSVRYIYTEVSHRAIYAGQCLFDDVHAFLSARGFILCTEVNRAKWQQNVIYAHKREFTDAGLIDPRFAAPPISIGNTSSDREPKDILPLSLSAATDAKTKALWLLFASARPSPSEDVEREIRKALHEGIDWALFAQKVLDHGLGPLCGHTLSRVAPDLVPEDVLRAFREIVEQTRSRNQELFYELALLLDTLKQHGIEAIPFKGPALAIHTFGDLGLRAFRDLDFLIRDQDLPAAIEALGTLGYMRQGRLTEAQFALIHRIQGQEIIFKQPGGSAVEPHTRFGPLTLALDLDYQAMRERAAEVTLSGHRMRMFAPEDEFIILATHGGKELWWNIKWACDAAAYIGAHPALDWLAIERRARTQGCLRMVLLATALARRYFGASIPEQIIALELHDQAIEGILRKIALDWRAGGVAEAPSNMTLSFSRLMLHDGALRRLRYVVRTLFLPKTPHVGLVALPARLSFLYIPIKLAHDLVALPLYLALGRITQWFRPARAKGKGAARASQPLQAEQWAARAQAFLDANRVQEAIETNAHALAIDPANVAALRVDFCAKMFVCDWRERQADKQRISDGLRAQRRLIAPLFHRALFDSEAEHFLITQLWTKRFPVMEPLWRGEKYKHAKIRVAYISTDFRSHVVSDVIAGCLEQHDKARFETTAISLGPDDGSPMRRRVERAFDRFIDAQNMQDAEIAGAMRKLEIDIAVDLNGYSGAKRTGIVARRPAPIQVNYLGYPGTMNAPFIDYIIADRIIIPEANRRYFSEKIAYLPDTFFPTDRQRNINSDTPTREQAGLPERGIVFACHSAPHKISPEIFDVWMRILHAVGGSLLWLKAVSPLAMENLRREAKVRGISPERLIFAPRLRDRSHHLARLRLADICLDTSPYNGHATACDALWAGVPVITCPGGAFPGRVAASLLHAVEMPDLITESFAEYEDLARSLAQNPERLAAVRTRLSHKRDRAPLFDTAGFTRNLEAAYTEMWARQQAGLMPATFSVAAQHSLTGEDWSASP
jgi:FkbM family methyltransferase